MLSGVIAHQMETLDMPMAVSPFDQPETFGAPSEREEQQDDVMSSES